MAIVGIDLGTTNSLVSVWKNEQSVLIPNSEGKYLTPSVVYFEKDKVKVGEYAKLKMTTAVDQTISSFKRDMGTERIYTFFGKKYTAPEVSSFIIRQLINDAEKYLNEKVEEAVISVPAYFNDKQRNATRLAGELAGITVNRIINEPSAAALAGRIAANEDQDKTCLVFDFGGGTLDISIVDLFDNVIEIVSVSGDNHLGGDDFDELLTKDFIKSNCIYEESISSNTRAVIKSQIRQMKQDLGNQEIIDREIVVGENTYMYHLDNESIVSICAVLFQRIHEPIVKAINDARIAMEELDEIIMVGGSSKMISVQKFVKYVCKKSPFVEEDCDYTIARGCGIVTGIIARDDSIKDVVLTDICPFTLGVSSHYGGPYSDIILSPIIQRNTVLPVSRVESYTTIVDNQTKVSFDILQGEQRLACNNLKIKSFIMEVPPKPAGTEQIEVHFTYDINGILAVEAKVISTGEEFKDVIIDKGTTLTKKELEEKIKSLEIIKNDTGKDKKYELLIARGEKLYAETTGGQRRLVFETLTFFQEALNTKRYGKIKRMYDKISGLYDDIEKSNDILISKQDVETYLEGFNEFLKQDDSEDDEGNSNLN